MPSIIGRPDTDWSSPSVRMTPATSDVRARRQPSRTSSEHVSGFARVQRRMVGKAIALAGSFNILLGTVLADQHRTAHGHRQRVVGMLQLNCEVDRRTADAFVDRWLSKRTTLQEV